MTRRIIAGVTTGAIVPIAALGYVSGPGTRG